uniref:CatA-like O-acetyltransferase n=1 Tax=Dysosmobacter welbionis TaxID=2093857 RepID=UPI003FED662A
MAQRAVGGRRRVRSAMACTPIDEQTWERREYLEVFRQTAIYLTAEVDITPLYRHTKARGEKLYPA